MSIPREAYYEKTVDSGYHSSSDFGLRVLQLTHPKDGESESESSEDFDHDPRGIDDECGASCLPYEIRSRARVRGAIVGISLLCVMAGVVTMSANKTGASSNLDSTTPSAELYSPTVAVRDGATDTVGLTGQEVEDDSITETRGKPSELFRYIHVLRKSGTAHVSAPFIVSRSILHCSGDHQKSIRGFRLGVGSWRL